MLSFWESPGGTHHPSRSDCSIPRRSRICGCFLRPKRSDRGSREIASYSHAKTNQRVCDLVLQKDIRNAQIIDVGAGEGYFSKMLGDAIRERYGIPPSTVLRACDIFPGNCFKYSDVCCDRVDLDKPFPYADGAFDVACSIEVVEHLENQTAYVRELYRITKPGGRVLVTTPNILNINSRNPLFLFRFLAPL